MAIESADPAVLVLTVEAEPEAPVAKSATRRTCQ
ncbi:hypothetical protein HNP00_004468 [Arthrobacter sp. AZCC_0090]|nr:hypothetical protein [Arthrobacter sp. AZCC_0090]